ncbi:cytochrome b/b6 domain-containing protein [Sandarakinorhabdus sp.]|uniref:cytochrome b n=1 Tax=Sandarakinorhabdus sp. TaxID=1916663 RepID=UPI00286D70E2|nr:cytochrome b/b6 domain-containing protein [Sandarakinorhabdus sp.]
MTSFYLGLAAFLAVSLNAQAAWLRVLGHLAAAAALALLSWSIWLANGDGTFGGVGARPLLLNIMGVLSAAAAGFVLVTIAAQWRRQPGAIAAYNTNAGFGMVSRLLHWSSAVLMLSALPMGLFVTVLPPGRADRAEFLGAHVDVGLAVLALLAARRLWLLSSPAPASPGRLAAANKVLLYTALFALPLSGLFLASTGSAALPFSVPALLPHGVAAKMHLGLAALFAAAFALHLGGVLAAYFWRRDRRAVRRMLR